MIKYTRNNTKIMLMSDAKRTNVSRTSTLSFEG